MKRLLTHIIALLITAMVASTAHAHFPWLVIDDQGNAAYFFGETQSDRQYPMPETVASAKVIAVPATGEPESVAMSAIETDDFVGMRSDQPVDRNAVLTSKVTYGVYHGSRLDYYTQHHGGPLPTQRSAVAAMGEQLALHVELVDTDDGVDVFVRWQGKPLADAKVQLFCDAGHEEGTATTDGQGKVSFDDGEVEEGLNGILVGHTVKDESGTFQSTEYQSVAHYLTATFRDPEDFPNDSQADISVTSHRFPPIAEAVTSFGAAVAGDALYVYGGHKGDAHQYFAQTQGNTLRRLNLKDPQSWEELGQGPGLQGLAMVAHGGKVYRLGGFTAKNEEGDEQDLWSQSGVACFDPATNQWNDLPPLPEPRSSFDAVVLGDQIFVVGGWNIQGDQEATWLTTAHSLDLSAQPLQWKTLPAPPFQRRALSTAARDGKVYAIGGMQEKGGPTTRVDVFDTQSQTWSRGPDLIGEGMDGFGSSSFAIGDHVYVTTYNGTLQRLSSDASQWEMLHALERERFFHRLLPINENELLTIGGASMESGKFKELDVIALP